MQERKKYGAVYHGSPPKRRNNVKRDVNIKIEGDTALVPLTQGETAVIDAVSVPIVNPYTWSFHNNGNAFTNVRLPDGSKRIMYMHNLIFYATTGMEIPNACFITHRNGNRLDNRMSNLELDTRK